VLFLRTRLPIGLHSRVYTGGTPHASLSQDDTEKQSIAGETMEAEHTLDMTQKHARERIEAVRARAEGWDEKLRAFAREKPLAAVFCAAVAGYALARIATWR